MTPAVSCNHVMQISLSRLIYCLNASSPAFIITPTSVNATLRSTATFNCSVTTGTIDWRVNGSLLTELSTHDIAISKVGTTFSLHVQATEEYNNTLVVCEVILRDPLSINRSDPAVLRVQGMFCLLSLKHDHSASIIK